MGEGFAGVTCAFFLLQEMIRCQRGQAAAVTPMAVSAVTVTPPVSAIARSERSPAFREV